MKLELKTVKRTVKGQTCHIRPLNGGAKAVRVVEILQEVGKKPQLMCELGALLISCCLVDEAGNLLYPDAAEVMEKAPLGLLTEFAQVALEVSGLDDDAKELAGNSEAVQ